MLGMNDGESPRRDGEVNPDSFVGHGQPPSHCIIRGIGI